MKRASTNSISTQPRLTTILGSLLEVIFHELLYTRSLYPDDAFSRTRHYGVACHACRHPDVVDYIFETLQVAVPGIFSGAIDGLYLIIYDAETENMLERYAFEFDLDDTVKITQSSVTVNAPGKDERGEELEVKIQELERSLRDVLLRIVSLDGTELGRKRGQRQFDDNSTFKLCLHAAQGNESNTSIGANSNENFTQQSQCTELEDAMRDGKWFRADSQSCCFMNTTNNEVGATDENNQGSLTRPLKNVDVPSCGLRMQLLMEIPKDDNR